MNPNPQKLRLSDNEFESVIVKYFSNLTSIICLNHDPMVAYKISDTNCIYIRVSL